MDLSQRISKLSPAQRKQLDAKLKEQDLDILKLPITKVDRTGAGQGFPLSFEQERLWFIQQLDPGNTSYNIIRATKFAGALNKQALERASTELIRRHDILRTIFITGSEGPVQVILNELPIPLEIIDLKNLPLENQPGEINRVIESAARYIFDLAKGPLLRTQLLILNEREDEHIFLLTVHHIVSDGTSIQVMVGELGQLYRAFSQARNPGLVELPIQYVDYACWQRLWFGEIGKTIGFIKKQETYWLEQFQGELPVLTLPADYARPDAQTFEGRTASFYITGEETRALKELAKKMKTTLYVVLLAIYNIFLAKLSGIEDIVVGTPVAGRRHPGVRSLTGMFVNTLALRNYPVHEQPFREFLEGVKNRVVEAFENQEYPYESLLGKLEITRDMARNPLFNVMFFVRNVVLAEIDIEGLKWKVYEYEDQTSQFDLTLIGGEVEAGGIETLRFDWQYCTKLFKEDTIERFTGYFKEVVKSVVNDFETRIGEIEIIPAGEKEKILFEFNDTTKEYPKDKTIHRLFAEQAEKSPDSIAVVGATAVETLRATSLQIQMSYRQLNEQSNRLAYLLMEKGIGRDGLVGILCKRSIEIVIAILAVWKAGGAYIPMNNDLPLERLIAIMADSEVSILLALSDSFPDTHKYYEKIGTYATVKHIIYLDKQENLGQGNNLFKTFRFASLLAKSMDIKPGKEQVLHYKTQTFTHQEYMRKVRQLTQFIVSQNLDVGARVAVMISNPIYRFIALLSLNVLHIPFILIDPTLPGNRRKKIIEEFEVKTVFVQDDLLDELDRWLWESDTLKNYIIFDPHDLKQSTKESGLKEIWNYVAEETSEAINDYGWIDSYTNKPFSIEEMNQYIRNFKTKLEPFLTPRSKVLEIGCGHGLVLFEIAAGVSFYYATDISEVIIEKNRKRLQREAFHNVKLKTASASEIDMLDEKEFDLVICSSVVHYFPNSFYLEKIINKAIALLKDQGSIYLDDLMDLDKKGELVRSTLEFKELNPEARTKTEWDGDLFVKKDFFKDLQAKYLEIIECEISSKLGDIKNELTGFRYDVVLKINKKIKTASPGILKKNRYSWEDIEKYSNTTAFSTTNLVIEDETNDGKTANVLSKRILVGDVMDISTIEKYPTETLRNLSHPADLSYVIYTSGTTGKPKGVMIEHRGMVNHIYAKINALQLDNLSIVAQNASQMFDISVWQFFAALITGGRTVIFPNEIILETMNFMAYILKSKITILEVVPSYLAALLDIQAGEYSYSSLPLQYLLVTGEAVNPGLLKRWFFKYPGIKVVNAYGPTEASDDITHYILDKTPEMRQVPIGSPVQNMNIYIVDKYMALCPLGVPGELCVSGAGIGRGYLNRPQLTADKFIFFPNFLTSSLPGFPLYRTGDLARWLNDGHIEFLGRMDHQVKIRGFRIELGEIETQLVNYTGIKEAVVLAQEGEGGDKYLCAYFVSDRKYIIPELREYLAKALPDYMIPSYFVQVEKIPLTPNGKVDRRALPRPEEISLREDVGYTHPTSAVEKKLAEIWEKVLGKNNIGINDNFFMIGGDSIKAIQIMARMSSAGYKLEMRDLFRYPVISALAPHVKKLKRLPDQSVIMGLIPLTPIQETFFAESPINPHHYNQAVMLYAQEGFAKETIKEVFAGIQEHHDALRTTYERDGNSGQVIQLVHGLGFPLSLQEYDLKNRENWLEELDTQINKIQASIDLEKGPLMKLGLFHLNDGDRLLIVIHHLAIDGVSWRILLEDIETLYSQNKRGEKLVLPPKTDSFKFWSEQLATYANSKTFLKEKAYWQKIESVEAPSIPKDFEVDTNYVKDTGSVSFTLGEEETVNMLTKANKVFGTENNDILLTAVGIGIAKTFGLDRVLIALEGHGREEILEDIDISRTIGWFTCDYPVVMDICHTDNPGRQTKEIKEMLRKIPNKGIGYGILKYLTHEENKKEIEFKLEPQIGFNYLGQFDADVKQISAFVPAKESAGNSQSLNNKREYLLEISGITAKKRLTMTIEYNKTHFKPVTMAALAENFEAELRLLIAFCCAKENMERTPSDFTYKDLSIERIDALMNEYPGIEDIYTLTPMQEGMLFHALADDSSNSYFEQMSYRLQGELDMCLVEKSLNELFKRHDILRTAFIYDDIERPVQLVLRDRIIDFYYEDISKLKEREGRENFIKKFKKKDIDCSFDLSKGTLMRVSILRVEESGYEITWSFHHILMDGWCIGILNAEFFEIYTGYLENRPHHLPAVKPYRTYILWLEKQDKEESARYWKNYLDSFEEQTGVPVFQAKILPKEENQNGYRNETVSMVLDIEKTTALKKLAAGNHVTLNIVTQVLWGILLGKYNGKEDVVFGAVVSGRPFELDGVESIVGLFINTIPVRIRYEEKMKFYQLLQQVQEEALAGEPYHYHSLAEIQALAALKQNLIDHILVFENYPIAEQMAGFGRGKNKSNKLELKITNVDVFEQTNYNFNIVLLGADRLRIIFKYNGNVYERDFVESIAGHFLLAIDRVIDNEALAVRELELLSEAEKNRVLYDFNNTETEYPKGKTIHRLFEEQMERTPDHIAVFGPGRTRTNTGNNMLMAITYHQLNEQSGRLARFLQIKGIDAGNTGSTVAIMIEPCIEMMVGILAVLKCGSCYLPIDPKNPEERTEYLLTDSEAKLLLTQPLMTAKINVPIEIVNIADERLYTEEAREQNKIVKTTEPVYMIYTSGTTGNPKGVQIKHENLINYVHWFSTETALTADDKTALTSSFAFDLGYTSIYSSLLNGAQLHLIPKEIYMEPERILSYFLRQGISYLKMTPSLFSMIVMHHDFSAATCRRLRLVVLGGEAINTLDVERAYRICNHLRVMNHYGPTETTIGCIAQFIERRDLESYIMRPTIGRPIFNTQVYILDKYFNLLPVGIAGELCIGGAGLAKGYFKRDQLTGEKFVKIEKIRCARVYRTADLGRWLPDPAACGAYIIEFLGRIDHQVKIRGFRVELGEIENRLLKHPGIKEAILVAWEEEKTGGKYICAYIVSDREYEAARIRDFLSKELPDYMIPSYFVQLEKIPLTPNGKVDRKALPKPELKTVESYTAPRNEIERKLVDLWSDILGRDAEHSSQLQKSIGIDDNFFQLGGHSLKATIFVSQIHKELNVIVPLAEVFKTPTIKGLAKTIENLGENKFLSIEPIEKKEYYRLSFAQKRLYFIHLTEPNSVAYNIPMFWDLEGGLDIKQLAETFRKLIARHESLRTSYMMLAEDTVQRIHDRIDFEIDYGNAENKAEISRDFTTDFIRPFDLSKTPLLRAKLIKDKEKSYILMVDMHHIITDGISRDILTKDFISLYKKTEVPSLKLQYKDFSEWQYQLYESGKIKKQEEYWLNRFKDGIPALKLPTDFLRPEIFNSDEGGIYFFSVDSELTARFNEMLIETGTTMYMFLLTVFNVMLSKYARQEDIVVGTPVAGRRHSDLEKIIGMFVNILIMKNQPEADKAFIDFLYEVKDNALKAYENQDYQFEELVSKLGLSGITDRNPLFSVVFADINLRESLAGKPRSTIIDMPGLVMKPVEFSEITSKFDLRLAALYSDGEIKMSLTYSSILFKRVTVEKMAERFLEILRQVLDKPDIKLKNISISHGLAITTSATLQDYQEAFEF